MNRRRGLRSGESGAAISLCICLTHLTRRFWKQDTCCSYLGPSLARSQQSWARKDLTSLGAVLSVSFCARSNDYLDSLTDSSPPPPQVQVGSTPQDQRIVGYITCTHLHAPEGRVWRPKLVWGWRVFPAAWLGPGCSFVIPSLWFCSVEDSAIRCEQLDMLLEWLADFRKSTSSSSTANPEELVAFDVVCGDLNFDNCSSGEAGCPLIQVGYWGRVGVPVTASNTGSSKSFLLLVSMWVGC